MSVKHVWGVALLLTMGAPVLAQLPSPGQQPSYPAEMTIVVPEVEVRSGPTAKYYPTSKLRQGDRVLVLRESKDQPGWLAIAPPTGSFSWVKAKNVKQVSQQVAFVLDESQPAPVMPGSSLVNQTPNVESVKVMPGTQLIILDRGHQADGETWLPIQPPPTEVRFIPSDAVRPPAAPVAVSPSGFPTSVGSAGSLPTPTYAASNVSANASTTLLSQGDQAYRIGNVELAKQLYRQAADSATTADQRNYALNRLASLGSSTPTAPAWQPNSTFMRTTGQTASSANYTTTSGPSLSQGPQWSVWGKLRKASFEKDGQPVYVLENRQGQPQLYAIAQPGMSLRNYAGSFVSMYGPITYRSEDYPRVQYMVVSHVALP